MSDKLRILIAGAGIQNGANAVKVLYSLGLKAVLIVELV